MAEEKSAEAVLSRAISTLRINQRYNEGMLLMKERSGEFASMEECELAGIAMVPDARRYLDDKLQEFWGDTYQRSRNTGSYPSYTKDGFYKDGFYDFLFGRQTVPEIVIGAGLHAAIYCAGRAAAGFPKPFVIAGDGPVGGTFSMSREPSFYLNSRNRPGLLGSPLENGALNVIPGAPIQPSMISFSEFQTNADLAFCIRLTLAKYARVVTGWGDVSAVGFNASGPYLKGKIDGRLVYGARVIDARGLGLPKDQDKADGKLIMTFAQFMASMDSGFPLRSIRRAAVIGAGDAGKCAIEALLGIGPNASMSTAGLDFVRNIDWYVGGKVIPSTCEEWRSRVRGRYQRIGSFLKSDRVRVIRERGYPDKAGTSVLINGRTYDKVILCTGNVRDALGLDPSAFVPYRVSPDGTRLAAAYGTQPYYRIGPAADLTFGSNEAALNNIPENKVAIFRLANRTAALAAALK